MGAGRDRPGARVADVGCGPGAMLPALSDTVGPAGRVQAVDADPAAVAAARALVAAAGLANVSVAEAQPTTPALSPGRSTWSCCATCSLTTAAPRTRSSATWPPWSARAAACTWSTPTARPCGSCPSTPTWPTWPSATPASGRPGGRQPGRPAAGRPAGPAGLEVVEFRGRYVIGEQPAGVRPPGWSAREAMVTAGVATEEDVRRWERAFQELEAAPVRPTFFAPFFTAVGQRSSPEGAYNQGNCPADGGGHRARQRRRDRCRRPRRAPSPAPAVGGAVRGRREREADFTSLSGEEVAPLYDPLSTIPTGTSPPRSASPASTRSPAASTRRCTGAGPGRSGSSPVRERARDQRALQVPDRPGRRRPLGRLRHADPDGPRLRRPSMLGEVGHCGVAVDSVADMEVLFDGLPWTS